MPIPESPSQRAPPTAPSICAPPGLRAVLIATGDEDLALLEWRVPAAREPAGFGPAEREVLRLAAAGLSNAEIACARRRSTRTVANQLARIYRRLGVRSRLELFARLSADRRREEREA